MRDVRSDIGNGTAKASGSGKVARLRALLALGAAAVIGLGSTSLAAAHDPSWDQVENIKEAATRLAQMQRSQGATKTFGFIDACYRTHSLSSEYTKAFEACIAQDYMETQILTMIYSRTPPDVLKRQGAPTPKMLVETMTRRVGAAFGQYKVPKEKIVAFQRNVDEHGFPLFFKTLFPGAKLPPRPADVVPTQPDAAPENVPTPAPEKKQ